jgi:hypothetical protein
MAPRLHIYNVTATSITPNGAPFVDGGVSVDLFIGDPACLQRGLGRAALGGYLRQVAFPSYPEETRAYISHELINTAALKCSQAVGFRPLRRFLEHGLEMMLLALDREP